jgi:hypothetical protein
MGLFCPQFQSVVLQFYCTFPLHFDILKQILRFWHRLENLDSSFPLLKAAYKCTNNLYEGKQQKKFTEPQVQLFTM